MKRIQKHFLLQGGGSELVNLVDFYEVNKFLTSSTTTPLASPYDMDGSEFILLIDATSGPFSVNLVSAAGFAGKTFSFKKIDSTASTVSLIPTLSETIDGNAYIEFDGENTAVTIISNGSNWYII